MSVLHDIIERKKIDVAARMKQTPPREVKSSAVPTSRSFAGAMAKEGRSFILEIKKASPSKGLIRENLDVRAAAREYAPFADAVSVLTDAPYFGGGHGNIALVRSVTEKPILCKDFILSPYQVYEARRCGADAVLLMLSVVGDAGYRECAAAAAEMSMDVLTEVRDEEELVRAIALGAKIIGINNRDLRTLNVDLATTERLAPLIPEDKIIVSESGILSRGDLERLGRFAGAFLVGSRLMGEKDLGRAVRELIFGRVKICGLTRAEDAAAAYEGGAVYGGLIFAEQSPRRVDEAGAAAIMRAAPLRYAGVFIDEPAAAAAGTAGRLGLAAVQLHGGEDRAYVSELRGLLPGQCEIWKAVGVGSSIPDIEEYGCDRLLLDARDKERRGGTGKRFDWNLLKACGGKEKIILAGGVNPENAPEAAASGCYAIDVNSGVEKAAGQKSRERIEKLFSALRG